MRVATPVTTDGAVIADATTAPTDADAAFTDATTRRLPLALSIRSFAA